LKEKGSPNHEDELGCCSCFISISKAHFTLNLKERRIIPTFKESEKWAIQKAGKKCYMSDVLQKPEIPSDLILSFQSSSHIFITETFQNVVKSTRRKLKMTHKSILFIFSV
jgi:hypothetical protein